MTFYLKYRPQKIEELDLESVRERLKNILQKEPIPHAFLFSGPKGTGKTSSARILAKVVNCEKKKAGEIEPCNKCDSCLAIESGSGLDVVEIDAASHRGIDDIRSLRESIKLAPSESEMKVYIIDEAHMLTTEASNAFLKTLEEPPEHVIFILATTNPEKLIGTIRSRTANVDFKKATKAEVVRSLNRVAKGESLNVDKEALELIAEKSDGSFRDAVKVLEELSTNGDLSLKSVGEYLFSKSSFDPVELIKHLHGCNTKSAIQLVNAASDNNVQVSVMIETTIDTLRNNLLSSVLDGRGDGDNEKVVYMIDELLQANERLGNSYIEILPFEIAIVRICERGKKKEVKQETKGNDVEKISKSSEEKTSKTVTTKSETEDVADNTDDEKDEKMVEVEDKPQIDLSKLDEIDDDLWNNILVQARNKNASTEALLRAAKPLGIDGNKVTVGVYYSFHKEHLESNTHRMLVEEVCSEIFGDSISIKCVMTDPPEKTVTANVGATTNGNGNGVSISQPVVNGAGNTFTPGGIGPSVMDPPLTDASDDAIIGVAEEIFSS